MQFQNLPGRSRSSIISMLQKDHRCSESSSIIGHGPISYNICKSFCIILSGQIEKNGRIIIGFVEMVKIDPISLLPGVVVRKISVIQNLVKPLIFKRCFSFSQTIAGGHWWPTESVEAIQDLVKVIGRFWWEWWWNEAKRNENEQKAKCVFLHDLKMLLNSYRIETFILEHFGQSKSIGDFLDKKLDLICL